MKTPELGNPKDSPIRAAIYEEWRRMVRRERFRRLIRGLLLVLLGVLATALLIFGANTRAATRSTDRFGGSPTELPGPSAFRLCTAR